MDGFGRVASSLEMYSEAGSPGDLAANRRLKRGCYGQYTAEQMLAAIQSYQCGLMGLNAAAKLFNIPRATLRRKVEGLPVMPGVALQVPPQPGVNAVDGSPQPQPSASAGRPPAQPKQQVDVKRESLTASPRERPSPSSHPAPMPAPANHPAAMATPPGHPAGLPAGHPGHPGAHGAHPSHGQQMPHGAPRRSAHGAAPPPMRPPGPPSPAMPPQPAAPPPEVCLRWNSYHSNMQATFPSLLNNEQFVDVTLACEGHSIKCHKVMLSACSSYFEELLSQNPCQHPIVLMKDLRFWEVQALVDFMYRGEVNVTQDKLPSLLAAAEALQIKGLAGPATNSHDNDTQRGNYEDPLRRRKRRMPMSDPNELHGRNPVGRPRIHPKAPQRAQALPAAQSPRIQLRPEQHLQRPIQLDDGPPAQRMKHSPPGSPPVKVEPLETDLSNDSLDKLRYDGGDSGRYDGGDSGGSGDGSNHGDALVDLSQGRFSINNGLQSDRNRDHSDNEPEDDRQLDEEEDREANRGQQHDRNPLREHQDMEQDNDQDDDHDMEHDNDNDQERDNDQALNMAGSEDDQDIHSSDEDQYDNEPPQDSRQQPDHLTDHLLGRL